MARSLSTVLVITSVLIMLGGAAWANDEEAPYNPETLEQESISLLEAISKTLSNAPAIALQEQSAESSRGALQQQSGVFDHLLTGSFKAEDGEQFLRESEIGREQTKRDDKNVEAQEARIERERHDRGVAELEAIIANPDVNAAITEALGDESFLVDNFPGLAAELGIVDGLLEAGLSEEQVRDIVLDNMRQSLTNERDELLARENRLFTELANLGEAPTKEEGFEVALSLNYEIPFRNGIKLTPFLDSVFSGQRYVGKPRTNECFLPGEDELDTADDIPQECGGLGLEDLYSHKAGIRFDFPLLAGRGREETGAFEDAAKLDVEAALYALQHTVSQALVQTASAFWRVRGAQEQVAILERSAQRQTDMLDMVQTLVDAEEQPRVELLRSRARSATVRGQLEDAQRALVEARVALASTIGLGVGGMENAPLAGDDFPGVASEAELGGARTDALIGAAPRARADLASARLGSDSGRILLRAAELGLRDVLDLSVEFGGNAVSEESFSESTDRWTGPDGSISLAYSHPFGNNIAEGAYLQRQAQLAQRQIEEGDLERVIKANVVDVMTSLREAASAVQLAGEAVESFQETADAEVQKYRASESTLIDVLLTEEQLVGAEAGLVQARQTYASLLARLWFETGAVIDELPEGDYEVDEDAFVSVPTAGGSGE